MGDEIMVPVDARCIPDGYEAVGIKLAKAGESVVWHDSSGKAGPQTLDSDSEFPHLIVRKKYDPGIKIKQGWWVWNNDGDWLASPKCGALAEGVYGLQVLPDFIPTPDGQPRQIK